MIERETVYVWGGIIALVVFGVACVCMLARALNKIL